jgi:acyl-coenzyme A synthetase/AMP-(fatty) acid ligase
MCHIEGETKDATQNRWRATGDLVKISSNGTMHFLSRISETRIIKRWGHKVSLSLIEVAANKFILNQASFALSNVTDTLQLVLFVVLELSPGEDHIQLVKQHLRTCLPSFALPDAIITLQNVPLTNHGMLKIQFKTAMFYLHHYNQSLINVFKIFCMFIIIYRPAIHLLLILYYK